MTAARRSKFKQSGTLLSVSDIGYTDTWAWSTSSACTSKVFTLCYIDATQ